MVKILVVDDSMVMKNVIKNTFEEIKIPFQYLEAGNGNDALLRLLENRDITMVFLDWNMPKMDGIEFLEVVRAMSKYKELPIFMITSEKGRFSVVEALKCGVTDYFVKPIKERIFRERVQEILHKRH